MNSLPNITFSRDNLFINFQLRTGYFFDQSFMSHLKRINHLMGWGRGGSSSPHWRFWIECFTLIYAGINFYVDWGWIELRVQKIMLSFLCWSPHSSCTWSCSSSLFNDLRLVFETFWLHYVDWFDSRFAFLSAWIGSQLHFKFLLLYFKYLRI